MKFIRKFAEFVGYTIFHGEKFTEWRCPNCGQKIKFGKIPETKLIDIKFNKK